jgi:hypothetical protein
MQNISKDTSKIVAGVSAIAVISYGIWSYFKAMPKPAEKEVKPTTEGEKLSPEEAFKYFQDAAHEQIKTLYKTEALKRHD